MTTRRPNPPIPKGRDKTPEPGPSYQPPDDLDLEACLRTGDEEVVYTPRLRNEEIPKRRTRNVPLMEQPPPKRARRDASEAIKEIRDILESFIEETRSEWAKQEQEKTRVKKELDNIQKQQEKITALLQDCQGRIGVAEVRILALQEARRDAALQVEPSTAAAHTETPHAIREPEKEREGGLGFKW